MGIADDGAPSAGLDARQRELWDDVMDGGYGLMLRTSAALNAEDHSLSEMRILGVIAAHRKIGITELSAAAHISISTLSRQVSRMVENGDVERIEPSADGRSRYVRITRRGRTTLRRQQAIRNSVIGKHVAEVLTEEEFEALGAIYRKIRASMD